MFFSRVFAIALCLCIAGPVSAQDFSKIVFFGDSTTDSGNYIFFNPLAPGLRPTTNPGPMWSEVFAAYLGATADPWLTAGGTNYAISGARVATIPLSGIFSVRDQITAYLGVSGRADPNALYVVWAGANDINASLAVGGGGLPVVLQAAGDFVTEIARLRAAGARYIVVPVVHAATRTSPSNTFGQFVQAYDDAVSGGLIAAGIQVIRADTWSLVLDMIANGAMYGFTHSSILDPACPIVPVPGNPHFCTPDRFVSPDAAQTYLFAVTGHLSTGGQKVVADYIYSLVVAPSQISMLAETPLKSRAAVIGTIQNQIAISERERGPLGINVWATGDIASLKIENYQGFPPASGTPSAITAGADLKGPPGWLFGFALSAGSQSLKYQRAGGFSQDEFAASFYAAFHGGPIRFDLIATYGLIDYRVHRDVPLGITTKYNDATTKGSNLSFGTTISYEFKVAALTHGPVAGIALQQVRVDGFAESGIGFWSLAFAEQVRNSIVTNLGYQISLEAGMFRPFARIAWNHELVSTERTVTASLLSIVAPSYSLPAVETGRDWGTVTVGTAIKLSPAMTGSVNFIGQFLQSQFINYGVQFGLNAAL